MNTFKKTPLALLLPVLLVGCGGGGGADLLDVPDSKVVGTDVTTPKKPNYKKVTAPEAEDFSELGFSAKAPMKNLDDSNVTGSLYSVNPDEQHTYRDDDYDHVMVGNQKFTVDTGDSESSVNWAQFPNNAGYTSDGMRISYSPNSPYKPLLKLTEYDHTRVGLLQADAGDGITSTVFYRGKDKTTDTPVSGTATYSGHWEFAHQISGGDTSNVYGGVGSEGYANNATFTADFATKKLTGNLDTQVTELSEIHYTVDADIKGNSFTGTGTGSYDFDKGSSSVGNGESTDSTAVVSGSFYGAGAAELAGRLVEDSNAFVGVFAAKQSGQTDLSTDGDLLQAGIMKFAQVGETNSYTLDDYEKTNFSGDINKLQLDGEVIDLSESADENLQTMRFGKLEQPENGNAYYYVQGYLTKASDVPTTGTAEYAGHWSGYGEGDAVFSGDKMDARFSADWASKTLDGKLYNANQSLEGDPAIAFSADISGNAFSGTTSTLKLDTNTGSLDSTPITGEANVSGHFYGDKANELGGQISKEDGSFGGVFGAKQTN